MLPILAQLYSELPMVPASCIRIWMKLWAWQTEKKEEHVISPQNKFCSVEFHPHPPFFPPTSPPLLHLGSDDSIGSSFKRISITETVFSLSVQASSHIRASLSCLLFHSVPLLFPGRGLLPFYVTSVCVGCKSTDRYCLFLGNQKRRAWSWNANSLGKKSPPFCWHWCRFRMQQTTWLNLLFEKTQE